MIAFKTIKKHSLCLPLLCALVFVAPSSPLFAFSHATFSKWDLPLSAFEKQAAFLEADDSAQAKKLAEELARMAEEDPENQVKTFDQGRKPEFSTMTSRRHDTYDYNRLLSKQNPQIYINASLVKLPEQDFLLAALPMIPEQVTELFMHLLEGNSSQRVWVSVLDSTEKSEYQNNFWKPDYIKTLPFRDGWNLIESSSKLLAEGAHLSAKGTKTALFQKTLVFSNGKEKKTIYHLHYDGWFDLCPCPDEGLFKLLLETMNTLNQQKSDESVSPARVPIIINCIGGIGRTGTTTVGYLCYLKIRSRPKDERASMILNLPEIIYEVRKQRRKATENYVHLTFLYKFFGKNYLQIPYIPKQVEELA